MKIIVTVIIMLIGALILQEAIRVGYLYKVAHDIDKNPILFSQKAEGSYSILIIGDRSVFASGLEDPFDSLPGQLALRLRPGNITVDGAPQMRIRDLASRLATHGNSSWDIIIISIGENDILHQTEPDDVSGELEEALLLARDLSNNNVIVIAPRDIGHAPIMPPVMPAKYNKLTTGYASLYADIVYRNNMEFIHSSYVGTPTSVASNDQIYINDRFHLGKFGNQMWAEGILENSSRLRPFLK